MKGHCAALQPEDPDRGQSDVRELLLLFLRSTDQADELKLLEQIVDEHARPLVKQIVRAKLRRSTEGSDRSSGLQDAEDIVSDVVLQLLRRLLAAKGSPEKRGLSDFNNYVTVSAHNAVYSYLRRKNPERSRLKDKIRYVLTYQKGFAVWQSEKGRSLCGFSPWRDQNLPTCTPSRTNQLRDDPALRERIGVERCLENENLAELLKVIFKWVGAPVEVDDLVKLVSDLWPSPVSFGDSQESRPLTELPDQQPSPATRIEYRQYLKRLWEELCQLPPSQRSALLLHASDPNGNSMAVLLAHTQVATIDQVAEALGLAVDEFAELSNELPMEDTLIAKRLGLSRQQVINSRVSARRKLQRRMKKLESQGRR